MEHKQELAKVWTSVYSSSISNWHDKLDKRLKLKREWRMFQPVIFIGLYHIGDYIRYMFHFGEKKVFWCGSDILNLEKSRFAWFFIPMKIATHYCENGVEAYKLEELALFKPVIIPMIFDDPDKYQPCFEPSDDPKFFYNGRYLTNTEGIEAFTLFQIKGVGFYGDTEERFNKCITQFQGSVRPNEFDGFSEITAKSILLGQYPITRIKYEDIDHYNDDEGLLKWYEGLKDKKVPNPAEKIWRQRFEDSLQTLLA